VTGSATAWMPPEMPDVSPESNDGGPSVAALACRAERDRSKQIPPLAIANRATRRMTRRAFGFDIDNSQSPGTLAYCSVTTVQCGGPDASLAANRHIPGS
jgi:hypothetical protein